jgi:hypothetical protein
MGVPISPQDLTMGVSIGSQGLYYGGTHKSSRPNFILWLPHSSGVTRLELEEAQPPLQMLKRSRNF